MRGLCFLLVAVLVGSVGGAIAQETPKHILKLDTGGHMALINDIAFTPDGKQLVSASNDKTIRVWDLETGETVRTIRGEIAPGNPGKIFAMALSPDGRWLAAGGWSETTHPIRLYDFQSGELVALLTGHDNVVSDLAFSPDGTHLISGSMDTTAIIWDTGSLSGAGVARRAVKHRLRGHRRDIYAVGFTPDGERAVTGSLDNDLRLWRVGDGEQLALMEGHQADVDNVAIAPDGTIASGDLSGEIRLWDGRTGGFLRVLARQLTRISSLSFGRKGLKLLSGAGTRRSGIDCHVYDTFSGGELVRYTGHDNIVLATAISPDGRWAATAGKDNNSIHIWDLDTGERRKAPDGMPLTLGAQGQSVWAVGIAEDAKTIGWGNTNEHRFSVHRRGPLQQKLALPLSSNARVSPRALEGDEAETFGTASAIHGAWSLIHRRDGDYGHNAILEIRRDGKVLATIERGSTDGFHHAAYSFTPDGQTIISGGAHGVLSAYDLEGNKRGEFIGHEGHVWAVAPSPDGRYLLSGSADQTVRLWSLETRELLVTLFHGKDGEWVMWTPEGFFTASENGAKYVGWHINQGADKEARYVTAAQVKRLFFRPDLVAAKIAGDPEGQLAEEARRLDIDRILSSGPAPKVEILTPGDGWQADDNTASVSVRISDQGGGIGTIRFFVNDRLKATARGRLMLDDRGTISREFQLASTDNTITIIASNAPDFVESEAVSVSVKVDEQTLKGVPDLYVLAIGVNTYKDRRRALEHAVSDAQVLGETLAAAGADYYRNAPHVVTLTDEEVTATSLERVFEELGDKMKARDVFVFFLAGHGKSVQGDYYFVPPSIDSFDRETILQDGFGPKQWRAWFQRIKAEKSVFIFDTCESGAASGSIFSRKTRGGDYDTAHRRLIQATGRTVLMAASDQDVAVEGYRGHGVFTYALLEAFAKADSNRNDEIEMLEVISHLKDRVPEISRELKACDARGPDEYCQRPEIDQERDPFYTLVPRYRQVLARLERQAPGPKDTIPTSATHVVLTQVQVVAGADRGDGTQMLPRGTPVRLVRKDGDRLLIAMDGQLIGYIRETPGALLKLQQ